MDIVPGLGKNRGFLVTYELICFAQLVQFCVIWDNFLGPRAVTKYNVSEMGFDRVVVYINTTPVLYLAKNHSRIKIEAP